MYHISIYSGSPRGAHRDPEADALYFVAGFGIFVQEALPIRCPNHDLIQYSNHQKFLVALNFSLITSFSSPWLRSALRKNSSTTFSPRSLLLWRCAWWETPRASNRSSTATWTSTHSPMRRKSWKRWMVMCYMAAEPGRTTASYSLP